MSAPVHNPALAPPGIGGGSPLAPATPAAGGRAGAVPSPGGPSFAALLARQAAPAAAPHFSRHALDRLAQRGIELSPQTVARLQGGIDRAAGKGSRDSVVFVDATAFVVSVRNNTVITAVDSGHMREQVFTNIDSAVIA